MRIIPKHTSCKQSLHTHLNSPKSLPKKDGVLVVIVH